MTITDATTTPTEVLVEGLVFPECPRWHDGTLFFTDMFAGRVLTWTPESGLTELLALDGDEAAGLGWLPEGDLVVVSSFRRRLLRAGADGATIHADLTGGEPIGCNDMVMDRTGRAFVGGFGYDLNAGAAVRPGAVLRVDPDGSVSVAATGTMFANGLALRSDGSLVVAESMGARVSVFTVTAEGELRDRRILHEFAPGSVPDGIGVDDEDGVWVTLPSDRRIVRLDRAGAVTNTLLLERAPYSCVLGGADGRDLHIVTAPSHDPATAAAARAGRVERVRVAIPGTTRDGLGG